MKKFLKIFIFLFLIFFSCLFFNKSLAQTCSPPPGGNYTITSSCAFSGSVNGVDNGNLIINSGVTLTINANQTIVYNPGNSITVNGSIAINKNGGQIKKGYLWMIDADSDNYPANTTQYVQDSAPPNGRRRHLMASITSIDCCESDSRANPGQVNFFYSRNNCNSWDYNCNNNIDKLGCSYATSCNLSNSRIGYYSWHCVGGSCQCGPTGISYQSCTEGGSGELACGESGSTYYCTTNGGACCSCNTGSCQYDYQCGGGCWWCYSCGSSSIQCGCR